MLGDNQKVSADELAFIRTLNDLDLTMLISEIHDHGWPVARKTLDLIRPLYTTEWKLRHNGYAGGPQ